MTNKGGFDLKGYLTDKKAIVDEALCKYFPQPEGRASEVIEAMRYSLFAGGKRLRPILCMAGAEAVKEGSESDVLPVACSLELIHTYSLIHDDLPAMDDDALRRGKPTNHKVFGEAIALLAGDGLLTEAFHLLAFKELADHIPPQVILEVVRMIAGAAGYGGMVGGQAVDIQWEGKPADFPVVEYIHTHKTGAMIAASVTSGALLAGGQGWQLESINDYGKKIGLAFQIADDILDIEGDSVAMGKKAGADTEKGKTTYPAVLGLEKSRKIQSELVQSAIRSLKNFDHKAEPLRQLAQYIIERKK
jgi:geranylgeranyl diphosphate synthase type II